MSYVWVGYICIERDHTAPRKKKKTYGQLIDGLKHISGVSPASGAMYAMLCHGQANHGPAPWKKQIAAYPTNIHVKHKERTCENVPTMDRTVGHLKIWDKRFVLSSSQLSIVLNGNGSGIQPWQLAHLGSPKTCRKITGWSDGKHQKKHHGFKLLVAFHSI